MILLLNVVLSTFDKSFFARFVKSLALALLSIEAILFFKSSASLASVTFLSAILAVVIAPSVIARVKPPPTVFPAPVTVIPVPVTLPKLVVPANSFTLVPSKEIT